MTYKYYEWKPSYEHDLERCFLFGDGSDSRLGVNIVVSVLAGAVIGAVIVTALLGALVM